MSVHTGFPALKTAPMSVLVLRRWTRWAVRVLGVFVLCAATPFVNASPVTYTITGTGQGTVNGTPFGVGAPVPFTIVAVGDSSAVTAYAPGTPPINWCNNLTSATYSIPSVSASGAITTPMVIVDNTGLSGINLGLGDCSSGPLWIDGTNAALSTYALATNVGPLALVAEGVNLGVNPNVSGGGVLAFTTAIEATFQATVSSTIVSTPTLTDYPLLGLTVLLSVFGFVWLRAKQV